MDIENTDMEAISRVWDVIEIKNLMGRHAYYHAYDMHEEEIDQLWVSEPEHLESATFGQNWGYQVGIDTIRKNYVDLNLEWRRRDLETLIASDPMVGHIAENLGIGTMLMHTLTTPYVEVSGDGKTAQGMWYSPGQVTVCTSAGAECLWMYEKYGVDFLREIDGWKIWHLFVGTDFTLRPGEFMRDIAVPDEEQDEAAPEGMIITIPMHAYSPRHNWGDYPRIPKPYESFNPAFGNGPEGNPEYREGLK